MKNYLKNMIKFLGLNCYYNMIQYLKTIFKSTIIDYGNEISLNIVLKYSKLMNDSKKFPKFKIFQEIFFKKL